MTKIFRPKKTVAINCIIALSILLLCAIHSVLFVLQRNYASLFILLFPVLLGILFAIIALIEYRGSVVIGEQSIIFNYKLFSKEKELNKSGVKIPYCEIESITKTSRKGDGIISKDCFCYTIHLTNNKQVDVYLYRFGKDEESIYNSIKEQL